LTDKRKITVVGSGYVSMSHAVLLSKHNAVVVHNVDSRYFRPAEVENLLGDPSNAKNKLGWVSDITVQEMCAEMVRTDLQEAKRIRLLKDNGYEIHVQLEG